MRPDGAARAARPQSRGGANNAPRGSAARRVSSPPPSVTPMLQIPPAGPTGPTPDPSALPDARPRRGAEMTVDVVSFGDRGKSVARLDLPGGIANGDAGERSGYVVFVPGGVPGDRVRVQIGKSKKGYAEARVLEIVEPSPLRVVPRCPYADVCGGCTWQHLAYPAQLEMKREAVERLLTHTDGLDLGDVSVRPAIGADRDEGSGGVYYYRNKMEFSFAAQRWLTDAEIATGEAFDRHFALGLHVPGRFDKVLDLHTCFLQSEWSARLVNGIRAFAKQRGWEPWHPYRHEGFLRHLVVRTSGTTDDRMVNLVTSARDEPRMALFADWLRAEFPETTTLVNTVNGGLANTSYGDVTVDFGPGTVRDRIGRHDFEIASSAFFQTNTRQAEALYAVAAEMASLKPTDVVYDLYCGAGTISLFVADRVARVVGVELVEAAVENARAAAVANGVANATFVSGDMLKLFTPAFVAEHGRPDVLIVDPPRAGMHPKVVDQIAILRPERIVYVSCNPRTQADDLARLQEATDDGYRIEAVQPVDLFPHTTHTECVIGLRAVETLP